MKMITISKEGLILEYTEVEGGRLKLYSGSRNNPDNLIFDEGLEYSDELYPKLQGIFQGTKEEVLQRLEKLVEPEEEIEEDTLNL